MTYSWETSTEEQLIGIIHTWCQSIGFTAVTLGIKTACYWTALSPTDFKQRWILTEAFSQCYGNMLDFSHKLENKGKHYSVFESAAILCNVVSTALWITDTYYDVIFTFCYWTIQLIMLSADHCLTSKY